MVVVPPVLRVPVLPTPATVSLPGPGGLLTVTVSVHHFGVLVPYPLPPVDVFVGFTYCVPVLKSQNEIYFGF